MSDPNVQKTEEELEAEVAALMAGTKKKKKDKKEKKKDKSEKKEKKKEKKDKKKKKKGSDDDADADSSKGETKTSSLGDAPKETYEYSLLLNRMYEILKMNNPEYAVKKRYIMAPPQVYRVGSTRTCWANFAVICGQMNRAPDHVLSFFLVRRCVCG